MWTNFLTTHLHDTHRFPNSHATIEKGSQTTFSATNIRANLWQCFDFFQSYMLFVCWIYKLTFVVLLSFSYQYSSTVKWWSHHLLVLRNAFLSSSQDGFNLVPYYSCCKNPCELHIRNGNWEIQVNYYCSQTVPSNSVLDEASISRTGSGDQLSRWVIVSFLKPF